MDQAKCPTSDTSPCKSQRHKRICGRGGIGRLGGFRFLCESVQVRVLSPAPNQYNPNLVFLSGRRVRIIWFLWKIRGNPFPKRCHQTTSIKTQRPAKKETDLGGHCYTACVEVKFADGSMIAIDCTLVEAAAAFCAFRTRFLTFNTYTAPSGIERKSRCGATTFSALNA